MPSTIRNSLLWVFEPFESEETYLSRKMFGADVAYVHGMQCLCVIDRDAPWDGLLVCTSHVHHASLIAEMPALRPHPVLGKWLYLPQGEAEFESVAQRLTAHVLAGDPRIGVEPKPRKPRRPREMDKRAAPARRVKRSG
ncbi:hypothetical protein [Pandoraea apista]|uniref:Uncharacterized protein n=1 Tax=Pandoraea apista TaxID=93218 RepID=A0A5E5P8U0_9BURK|nr:hypothetical protein [Pandoraea apista]AVF40791.1 hypothetical protein AL486_14540 [Pandoraea apista]OXS96413.1 hypothetical protein B7H01_04940 [Pandoraea apista]PTD99837.1 hypothetical protein C7830_17350 [Pandoraea apista]RRJ32131.1 hypothetical protein EIB05_10560 [Pandoraea apista]RRJ80262.1 hypothetical protein EIL82_10025 [Pandoraea apista]